MSPLIRPVREQLRATVNRHWPKEIPQINVVRRSERTLRVWVQAQDGLVDELGVYRAYLQLRQISLMYRSG